MFKQTSILTVSTKHCSWSHFCPSKVTDRLPKAHNLLQINVNRDRYSIFVKFNGFENGPVFDEYWSYKTKILSFISSGVTLVHSRPKSHWFTVDLAVFCPQSSHPKQDSVGINYEKGSLPPRANSFLSH